MSARDTNYEQPKNMTIRKLFIVLVSSFFGASVSSGREIDLEKPSAKLKRFLSDVDYVVEAGDRERFSKRLPESIIVNFNGQAAQKAVTEKQLAEFFCKVTGVNKLENVSAAESAAKIEIYFGREAELVKVANELEKRYHWIEVRPIGLGGMEKMLSIAQPSS